MTVGELKEFLKGMDDNTKIVTTSDNYELHGSTVDKICVWETVCKVEKRNFRDSFDGTNYSVDVYVPSKDGSKVLYIG